MLSTDEITLLEKIRTGDQAAFRELYAAAFPGLVRVASALSGETLLAKDAVQNAFLQFWQKRHTVQVSTAIFPYLRRMVIHEVLAMRRKSDRRAALWQRRPSGDIAHNDSEEALLRKETEARIRKAIDTLPERCSEIFKLSRYSEMTYTEIAEALDISVKTVENQMGKALKVLRETLRDL